MSKKIAVTYTATINCYSCSGKGWQSIYHNDTEDCSSCSGTGKQTGEVPFSLEAMKENINYHMGAPVKASDFFEIAEIHRRWRKSKDK